MSFEHRMSGDVRGKFDEVGAYASSDVLANRQADRQTDIHAYQTPLL